MAKPKRGPSARELALAAVESAKAHFEAAKLLSAAGRHDFATFHLLTSIEEICKSRLVGPAFAQLMEALEADGLEKPDKSVAKLLFSHSTKIPMGMLFSLIQSGPLSLVKHPNFPSGLTAAEVAEVKARELVEVEWLAANLQDPEAVREQAIYAGLDRSGKLPTPLNWPEFVEHLSPLIEDQLDFSEYIVQQQMRPEELDRARARANAWISKLRARGNSPTGGGAAR